MGIGNKLNVNIKQKISTAEEKIGELEGISRNDSECNTKRQNL